MTDAEKVAWYDALVAARSKLESGADEDWYERIGEVLDELWYSSPTLQQQTAIEIAEDEAAAL